MTIPYLRLWRTLPPDVLQADGEVAENIVSHLCTRLVPQSDRERTLLDQLIRGYFYNDGLRLAVLWDARQIPNDLAMSAALISALSGSGVAALTLAQALFVRAKALRAKAARRRFAASAARLRREARTSFRLALGWFDRISMSITERPQRWADEFAALTREPAAPPDSAKETKPAAEINEAGGPSLVLVREIGDAESDVGRELARTYADLCAPLPLAGGDVDLAMVEKTLRHEFPHLNEVIDGVMRDLHLQRYVGRPWLRLRPALLVGPPGVGKTRLVKRLAELLRLGYAEVGAAGSSDDRMLRGTARGWHSVQPALPLQVALRTHCANPLILIDEIDKAGGTERSGDIRQSLLGLLEPQTARVWFDEALLSPCDLSQVSWLLTANQLAPISAPLLSRMAVLRCPAPRPEDGAAILSSLLDEIARSLGVERLALPELDATALAAVHDTFVRTGDIRRARRALEAALGVAAKAPRTRQ